MKIELHRLDDPYHFESTSAEGHTARNDGSPAIGGKGQAMRPMEMLLASIASCSSIDVVFLLKKQRQEVKDIRVSVEGQRVDTDPRVFHSIHVSYTLVGDIDNKKAERACRLSMEKMCSVSMMLKAGGVAITWDYEVI